MKPAARFTVAPTWRVVLADLGLVPGDVLRHARLPPDLLERPGAQVTAAEYFRLFDSLGALSGDPAFPLAMGQAISTEAVGPPVLAALCSPTMAVAVERLALYKPLIGPLTLASERRGGGLTVRFGGLPFEAHPPPGVYALELVFLTRLIRMATRCPVVPRAAAIGPGLPERARYEAYLGCRLAPGGAAEITFAAEDAERPFLTENAAVWQAFEPELAARLAALAGAEGIRNRVRAVLMETLPSGQATVTAVAGRLAVSERSLQRRLRAEGTSFQALLNGVRAEMARHYLLNSGYSSAEIAFLLGYADPNSFIRAFGGWTGTSPELARRASRPA